MQLPLELMEERVLPAALQTSFSCFVAAADGIGVPSQGGAILLRIKRHCSTSCRHRGSVEQEVGVGAGAPPAGGQRL